MKFFLDTANLDEIRDAVSFGVLDGVTTNPSLVSKEGEQKGFKDLVKEICEIVKGPVSAEVLSTDIERMID
ncbi:MAG: fructose-6-phosphate aldolase, partial [Candidatus Dadabacteria bacterium]